jgi:hypothetical protein
VGNALDGDGDNNPGGDYSLSFFELAGDINRDRSVGFIDLVIVAQNYGSADAIYSRGDLTGDGAVGFSDLVLIAQNYGHSLPAPALAPSLPAAIAPSPVSVPAPAPIPVASVRTPTAKLPTPARAAQPTPVRKPTSPHVITLVPASKLKVFNSRKRIADAVSCCGCSPGPSGIFSLRH